jgi:hypothetical protein
VEIRSQTFWASYGYYLDVFGFIFTSSFSWIAYGLVLGFLYELLHRKYNIPKEKKKIITYGLISGIIPGAIAGLADGFASSIANLIMYALDIFKLPGAPTALTFEFWLDQSGTHLFINLVWGALFGAMFARFYNLIPSKGILKGLYYSLMVYLFTTVQSSAYEAGWWLGSFSWDAFYIMLWGIFVGFLSTGIALGLVLGALYKPPK